MASRKKVTLCTAYWTGEGCEDGQCQKLHLCRYFLQTYCTSNEECRFSHNVSDGHNARVLDAAGKPGLTFSELKFAYKRTQAAPKRLPVACKFYNGMGRGCKHGDDAFSRCPCLHICKYFILEKCKFGARCSKSHSLAAPQPAKILQDYGISIHDGNEAGIVAELRNFYLVEQEQSLEIDFENLAPQEVDRLPPRSEMEDGEIVEDSKEFNGCPPPVPWPPLGVPIIPPTFDPFGPLPGTPFYPAVISNDLLEDPIFPYLAEPPHQGMPLQYGTVSDGPEIPKEDNSGNKETVSSPTIDDVLRELRSTAEKKPSRKKSAELNELGLEGKPVDTDYRVNTIRRNAANEMEDSQDTVAQHHYNYNDSDLRFPDAYVSESDRVDEKFISNKNSEGTRRDLSPPWEERYSPNSYRYEDDRLGHDNQSRNNPNYSLYRRKSPEARLATETNKFRRSPSYERHWHDNNRENQYRGFTKRSYDDTIYDDGEMARSNVHHRNTEKDFRFQEDWRGTFRRSPLREESYREEHERHNGYKRRREHGPSHDRRSHDMGNPWDKKNQSKYLETSEHHREMRRRRHEVGRHTSPDRRRERRGRYSERNF